MAQALFAPLSGLLTGSLTGPLALSQGGIVKEAAQLIVRMTVKPTAARVRVIDTLMRALLTAGVWPKLDALYLLAAHHEQAARLNWVSAAHTMTAVNSPTFTVDRGFNGNGTTSYMNTTFDPGAAAGAKFVRDSAFLGIWSLTDSSNAINDIGNWNGAWGAAVQARIAGNRFSVAANSGVLTADTSLTSVGFFAWSRTNATTVDKYFNDSLVRRETSASSPVNTLPFYLGALNQNGAPQQVNTRQYACAVAGGALTQIEQAVLYTALRSYLSHPTIGAV